MFCTQDWKEFRGRAALGTGKSPEDVLHLGLERVKRMCCAALRTGKSPEDVLCCTRDWKESRGCAALGSGKSSEDVLH